MLLEELHQGRIFVGSSIKRWGPSLIGFAFLTVGAALMAAMLLAKQSPTDVDAARQDRDQGLADHVLLADDDPTEFLFEFG